MNNIEQIVLESYGRLLDDKEIDAEPSINMKMTRENGMDSLGIVSLIIDIEEALEMDLDECLAQIRKCTTIQELIDIIRNHYEIRS